MNICLVSSACVEHPTKGSLDDGWVSEGEFLSLSISLPISHAKIALTDFFLVLCRWERAVVLPSRLSELSSTSLRLTPSVHCRPGKIELDCS